MYKYNKICTIVKYFTARQDQCNIWISLEFTFDRGLQFEMNLTTKIVNLAKSNNPTNKGV